MEEGWKRTRDNAVYIAVYKMELLFRTFNGRLEVHVR